MGSVGLRACLPSSLAGALRSFGYRKEKERWLAQARSNFPSSPTWGNGRNFDCFRPAGYRLLPKVISYAVWRWSVTPMSIFPGTSCSILQTICFMEQHPG
ncbi:hypothetical protein SBC1_76720 (plasmid) [Caballeronia sp. SBC1]|nr:hypothetical protein SBC2_79900 [Caballeronia sp. SBC2]QIN67625.1 hypothetical protein SBC1_76720 [Caballeronia sp. SBC1]